MSSTAPARLLVIALTSLLLGPLAHSAESNDYQAEQATEPLALLLSIANDEVPRSTCRDPHGAPSLKLKDLLAPQLANLDQGDNTITGSCKGDKERECFVKIHHVYLEALSSFEIRFKAKKGRVIKNSFSCNITP